MPKKSEPVEPVTTQLNDYEKELVAQAEVSAGIEEVVGNFISTQGGILTVDGEEVPGNRMNVVVIDFVRENHYYDQPYDADNPVSPVCYAYGTDEALMKPHPECSAPQHPTCKGCPRNEWGTADQGAGKSCKNIRRLACITEDGLEDVAEADMRILKTPVTSGKNWGNYVNEIAKSLKRPPLGVVTEVHPVRFKSYFKLEFKCMGQITDGDILQALLARRKEIMEKLTAPYPKPQAAEGNQSALRGLKGTRDVSK
jgi:hypothetical protein